MNTLVLAYPNQPWLKEDFQTNWNLNPSTLCLLGAMVEELVSVEIVDAQFYDMSVDEFVDSVVEKSPKYIGISVLSTEYKEVLHIAAASLKERMPDLIIIAGGVHVTIEHLDVMSDQNIDYAVVGDGEYVLHDLIQCLEGFDLRIRHQEIFLLYEYFRLQRHQIPPRSCADKFLQNYFLCPDLVIALSFIKRC